MQNLRRLTQGLFLLLFLFLFIQTESKGNDELGYPVRFFLDFDPLILITTLLSAHAASTAFYLSIITIVITVLFGRVFCGWACPLGTLNNVIGSIRKHRLTQPTTTPLSPPLARGDSRGVGVHWYRVKYYILIGMIASAVFTLQPVGIMDPLSLLIRSFSISVYPLFNYGVRATFDGLYNTNLPAITAVSEPVFTFLKKTVLSFEQSFYNQNVLIGALFFIVLG